MVLLAIRMEYATAKYLERERTVYLSAVTEANQLRTERLENRCAINARVGFRLLAVLQVIFPKVQRFGSRKTTQYQ